MCVKSARPVENKKKREKNSTVNITPPSNSHAHGTPIDLCPHIAVPFITINFNSKTNISSSPRGNITPLFSPHKPLTITPRPPTHPLKFVHWSSWALSYYNWFRHTLDFRATPLISSKNIIWSNNHIWYQTTQALCFSVYAYICRAARPPALKSEYKMYIKPCSNKHLL